MYNLGIILTKANNVKIHFINIVLFSLYTYKVLNAERERNLFCIYFQIWCIGHVK